MSSSKKSKADQRTVGLFDGKTKEEVDKEALALVTTADAKEQTKSPEPIEVSAERWRDTAFHYQAHLSKHFNDESIPPNTAKFRLSFREDVPGFMFLEQFRADNSGKAAYHWSGVMFPSDNFTLYELTSCLVEASKIRAAKLTQKITVTK